MPLKYLIINIVLKIKIKSCNIEFKVAADKPPIDQIISEQLITGLLVIFGSFFLTILFYFLGRNYI